MSDYMVSHYRDGVEFWLTREWVIARKSDLMVHWPWAHNIVSIGGNYQDDLVSCVNQLTKSKEAANNWTWLPVKDWTHTFVLFSRSAWTNAGGRLENEFGVESP